MDIITNGAICCLGNSYLKFSSQMVQPENVLTH